MWRSRNAFFLESLQNLLALFSKFLQTGSWYYGLLVDIKANRCSSRET